VQLLAGHNGSARPQRRARWLAPREEGGPGGKPTTGIEWPAGPACLIAHLLIAHLLIAHLLIAHLLIAHRLIAYRLIAYRLIAYRPRL
jgi:hypothetical protein